MLLADGTYFVLESDSGLVACGGWSRRDRLYTGSGDSEGDSRILDPATEPARPARRSARRSLTAARRDASRVEPLMKGAAVLFPRYYDDRLLHREADDPSPSGA